MRQRKHIGYILLDRYRKSAKWREIEETFRLGRQRWTRRECFDRAVRALGTTEDKLTIRILTGLSQIVRVYR